MSLDSTEALWQRKAKALTQALIVSCTLNIGLIATFAYVSLQEKKQALNLERRPGVAVSPASANTDLLRSYCLLPYPELMSRLEDRTALEEGLTRRDLALACLVAFHHFDLDRALGGQALQKRTLLFSAANAGETLYLPVFPGLSDVQYTALIHYAKTEKWPLTHQGLFFELKRSSPSVDPSLLSAFYLTSEYHAAYLLLTRSGLTLSQEEIALLLAEGAWEQLVQLAAEQKQTLDISPERRLLFLLGYLEAHSPRAAQLIAHHHLDSLLKKGSDVQILTLLDLYAPHTPTLELFLKGLLVSPRTEAVYRKAANLLYTWRGALCPEPYDHIATLRLFLPDAVAAEAPPQPAVLQPNVTAFPASTQVKKVHTIVAGDSLWKIARKYHVSVEELKRVNHLDSEKLRLGKTLEIPVK